MNTTFRWLHLTDLHFGLDSQDWLWPQCRGELFEDLAKLHAVAGPWDIVFFTGDLTQAGSKPQFDALDQTLDELLIHLEALDTAPMALLPVPGNHDLQWRKQLTTMPEFILSSWLGQAPALRDSFWADKPPGDACRRIVEELFAPYTSWWTKRAQKLPPRWNYQAGLLPGEYSLVIPHYDRTIGVVGLNTAFLQFTSGVDEGRLELHPRQFHAACGGDGTRWARAPSVNFLLTHHPPSWLHHEAQMQLAELVSSNFTAHLHGHMHVPRQTTFSGGGGKARRWFQGPSLFGLETISGSDEVDRIHGYTAGALEFRDDIARLRYWPRDAQLTQDGTRKLGPDRSFTLEADNGTKAELIAVSALGGIAVDQHRRGTREQDRTPG